MNASEKPDSGGYATAEIAAIAGYSVQQVRDLERLEVIPPAHRRSNGYRLFYPVHLVALRAYRNLALAVGPVEARNALREVYTLPFDRAVARIVALHVGLSRLRDDALAALGALDSIVNEQRHDPPPSPDDVMTITELAAAIGVRTSTLRFWESVGLLAPDRVTDLNVRRYPLPAIREARIVAALRAGGYRIPAIREVVHSIRRLEDVSDLRAALQHRLRTIAKQSHALLSAGADIVTLLPS